MTDAVQSSQCDRTLEGQWQSIAASGWLYSTPTSPYTSLLSGQWGAEHAFSSAFNTVADPSAKDEAALMCDVLVVGRCVVCCVALRGAMLCIKYCILRVVYCVLYRGV